MDSALEPTNIEYSPKSRILDGDIFSKELRTKSKEQRVKNKEQIGQSAIPLKQENNKQRALFDFTQCLKYKRSKANNLKLMANS